MEIIKLMRIKCWIKNFLVFLPLLFGGEFLNQKLFLMTSVGFVSLCLVASMVYIINDIVDIEKDRNHPRKCRRPLASGSVSIKQAIITCVFLLLFVIFMLIFTQSYIKIGIMLLVYFILNIAYSLKLKNMPIIDVSIIVLCFFIRVLLGSVVTGIEISGWLFLTVISGSFFLALGKRRNELEQNSGKDTRVALKYYTYEFLDKNMYMCIALTNVFYSLWAVENSEYTMWTIPLLIVICMKYSLDIEGDSEGDPTEVIFHDKLLILLGLIFAFALFVALYVA